MTAGEVRELLRKACEKAGTQGAWAKAHEVSAAYVSDVILGRRDPGPAICEALGLEAVPATTYRRKK